MSSTIDLRGSQPPAVPAQVLADPTGRRARRLRRAGRLLAAMFVLWLAGLWLAGLGLLPAGYIPLSRPLGNGAPAPLRAFPAPARTDRADLAPARPLASTSAGRGASNPGHGLGVGSRATAGVGHHVSHPGGGHRIGSGKSTGPARVTGTGTASGAGSGTVQGSGKALATAPGQTTKQSSPGHTKTAPVGGPTQSGNGRPTTTTTTTTTATTSPGNSGSTLGQIRSGHGYPY